MDPRKFGKKAYGFTAGLMAAAFILKFMGMERQFLLLMFLSAVVLTVVSVITLILAIRRVNQLQAEKPYQDKAESRSNFLQVADELKAQHAAGEEEGKA